jgi:hypothetical protein
VVRKVECVDRARRLSPHRRANATRARWARGPARANFASKVFLVVVQGKRLLSANKERKHDLVEVRHEQIAPGA